MATLAVMKNALETTSQDCLEICQETKNGMETWYSLSLGDGIIASVPADEIELAFRQTFASAEGTPDLAVFTRPESEGRLYCEVIAYFSPATANLAAAFDAQPCEKPARAGLGLLAGSESAWAVLFPETGG
jgi:hypothetical protein